MQQPWAETFYPGRVFSGKIVAVLQAVGEFVEIEKFVRPVEGAKVRGNARGSLIGPQIETLRAAA